MPNQVEMLTRAWILAVIVPMLVFCAPSNSEKDMKGPVFIKEPDNRIDFSNSTGSVVECRANGSPPPEIIWVRSDGTAVGDVPGLRQVGNLQISLNFNANFDQFFRFYRTAISSFHPSALRIIVKKFTPRSTLVSLKIKSVQSSRVTFMLELVS